MDWQTANLAKTYIEVSSQKNPSLNPKNTFQKLNCLKSIKFCFLVTFDIIISHIFPENVIDIHQVSQKMCIFTSSILTISINFLNLMMSASII